MPRSTPAADTEVLTCRRSNGRPTAFSNSDALNDSRKIPRSSPCRRGVNSQAPGTDNSRICISPILFVFRRTRLASARGQAEQILAVARAGQRFGQPQELIVVDIAHPPRDLFGRTDFQALTFLDGTDVVGRVQQRIERPGVEP